MALTISKITKKSAPAAFEPFQPTLPDFEPIQLMLASSELPEDHQIQFPLLASYKYDGFRCAAMTGKPMSRKMLELPNAFVRNFFATYAHELQGFDGEFIIGLPNLPETFNKSTAVNKASGTPDFAFYVFDIWDLPDMTAEERNGILNLRYDKLPPKCRERIVVVEQFYITNLKDLKDLLQTALDLGYEGLITKKASGRYKYGRSTLNEGIALKHKLFADSEAIILGVKQGQKNGNEQKRDELGNAKRSSAKAGMIPVDQLGGFEVEDCNPESEFYGKQFTVGPGCLTKKELEHLWSIRHKLPGQKLTYKHQPHGAKDLPRFPGFKAFPPSFDR